MKNVGGVKLENTEKNPKYVVIALHTTDLLASPRFELGTPVSIEM